ncbi:hypothetical protein EDD86DRAFT_199176 [Gorgonomyces haynaldii]|nr:hypothetical protein EDD86DRAFT_199176 [Gorgonomyces haynaldii]
MCGNITNDQNIKFRSLSQLEDGVWKCLNCQNQPMTNPTGSAAFGIIVDPLPSQTRDPELQVAADTYLAAIRVQHRLQLQELEERLEQEFMELKEVAIRDLESLSAKIPQHSPLVEQKTQEPEVIEDPLFQDMSPTAQQLDEIMEVPEDPQIRDEIAEIAETGLMSTSVPIDLPKIRPRVTDDQDSPFEPPHIMSARTFQENAFVFGSINKAAYQKE